MGVVKLKLNITYKTTECLTCGVVIALVSDFYNNRLRTGKNYYCPNGHSQYFIQGQTEEDVLKKQLETERSTNKYLHKQNEHERNRTRAQKAAKTRIKNRIKNGVCPCCNRTFKQLARHMKNQHPEYGEQK